MDSQQLVAPKATIKPARFETYGVKVSITSNRQDMVDDALAVARVSMLGNVSPIRGNKVDVAFDLPLTDSGEGRLIQDGVELSAGGSRKGCLKLFDSILRVAVGERANGLVFVHAGVVGWNGKAIVLPADSFKGKSSLVTELVRQGAEYYSDEFAIFDADGLVHPFPRAINRRTKDYQRYEIEPDTIGKCGSKPIPVGLILITEYRQRARWQPKFLGSGQGVLEMIPFTLPIRYNPDFSLRVLNKITSRAIIASSFRGNAENFAKTLLNFVDKTKD